MKINIQIKPLSVNEAWAGKLSTALHLLFTVFFSMFTKESGKVEKNA